MFKRRLIKFVWYSFRVSFILLYLALRHPGHRVDRNAVGNFMILDKKGRYRGYIDYLWGEVDTGDKVQC